MEIGEGKTGTSFVFCLRLRNSSIMIMNFRLLIFFIFCSLNYFFYIFHLVLVCIVFISGIWTNVNRICLLYLWFKSFDREFGTIILARVVQIWISENRVKNNWTDVRLFGFALTFRGHFSQCSENLNGKDNNY